MTRSSYNEIRHTYCLTYPFDHFRPRGLSFDNIDEGSTVRRLELEDQTLNTADVSRSRSLGDGDPILSRRTKTKRLRVLGLPREKG